MEVSLIDYTGRGSPDPWYAANLMIFTKNTRVEMDAGAFDRIAAWPIDKKHAELEYMANTIPSSWEFCEFTFMIRGVTRALTHQLVRARHASFAQQTMQVLDMSQGAGWTYDTGPTIRNSEQAKAIYDSAMAVVAAAYKELIEMGCDIADARGVLPTNIHTNIIMKVNLRTLCELISKRESPRNLGEIARLMLELKRCVEVVMPWAELFFRRTRDLAAGDLDNEIKAMDLPRERRMHLHKLVDQMRQK